MDSGIDSDVRSAINHVTVVGDGDMYDSVEEAVQISPAPEASIHRNPAAVRMVSDFMLTRMGPKKILRHERTEEGWFSS